MPKKKRYMKYISVQLCLKSLTFTPHIDGFAPFIGKITWQDGHEANMLYINLQITLPLHSLQTFVAQSPSF